MQEVYLAAWQLRIDNVVRECARHLVEELCADSCIETRSLPGINKNKTFVQSVDAFISKEVRNFVIILVENYFFKNFVSILVYCSFTNK